MSTPTAAQIAGRQRRADRQAAQRATAVAAVSTSREAGKHAGMDAVTGMREVLAEMRAATAGDPVARAVASTRLLHALVGDGPGSSSDSLAAAGKHDRQQAVTSLLADPDLGLDLQAIATVLGLADESRVREIVTGPRRRPRVA